jgi:predicted HTH transcriptional regulator
MKLKHFFIFLVSLVVVLKVVEKFMGHDLDAKEEVSKHNNNLKKKEVKPAVVAKIVSKTTRKKTSKVLPKDNLQSDLNARQQKIIGILSKEGKLDTSLLEKHIKNVTRRTLRRDLDVLEKMKILKKVGKTKGSYYIAF